MEDSQGKAATAIQAARKLVYQDKADVLMGLDSSGVAQGLVPVLPELRKHRIPYYFIKTEDCTWAVNLLQRRLINLGYLRQGNPRAERHLRALESALRANGHLMHRYRHHDGIGDTHATFTVCGFWHVEAVARLGHVEEAEDIFQRMLSHGNHVGLFSEDIDPVTGQQLGNFPQTYSHVGIINAAFAISPLPIEVGDP